jgi:long-subunit acyl-CoA synthetase (AMP-forming)
VQLGLATAVDHPHAAEAFTADGYLRTGDVRFRRDDGNLCSSVG